MKKIDIVNLGCSKNLVDSEFLYSQLKRREVAVSINPDTIQGDVAIINTCGFIGDAKEESIDTILEFVERKKTHPDFQVFVMGCLSERYLEELRKDIPEVDQFYGVNDLQQIIHDLGYPYDQEKALFRKHSTPTHFAYLKIAEGCDRNCAFCAIPDIRGKQISKSVEDLVRESVYLAQNGVKELILISQELTRYGVDLYKKPALSDLVKELAKVDGIEWIRLHYTYPNWFGDDLITTMANEPKVCHYLDMPFQHFNDRVLKMMRRGHTKQEALELIERLRQSIPDLALRTTLLVGHPGEDEEAFEELLEMVQTIRFDRLGVFTYSHEEGTYGGIHYQDEIPEEVKQDRADRIMALQQEISLDQNQKRVGQQLKVLVDEEQDQFYVARTQYDSPEIDNEVLISKGTKKLEIGSFFDVRISDANEFDLTAQIIE